ncbi:MAG: hypothetical protein IPG67_06135 [Acidobacteria bacterium]|nr:hypothetical protein [Acidobacteriota bacterium]
MQDNLPAKTTRSKMPPKGWVNAVEVVFTRLRLPSRFRRILNKIFNRYTLAAFLILLITSFLMFTYFWFEFSDRIDRKLLSGEVFTPLCWHLLGTENA